MCECHLNLTTANTSQELGVVSGCNVQKAPAFIQLCQLEFCPLIVVRMSRTRARGCSVFHFKRSVGCTYYSSAFPDLEMQFYFCYFLMYASTSLANSIFSMALFKL